MDDQPEVCLYFRPHHAATCHCSEASGRKCKCPHAIQASDCVYGQLSSEVKCCTDGLVPRLAPTAYRVRTPKPNEE